MNLNDRFVQLLARPQGRLGLRFDVHRLTLASADDLWYGGSGATSARQHWDWTTPTAAATRTSVGCGRLRVDEPVSSSFLAGPGGLSSGTLGGNGWVG